MNKEFLEEYEHKESEELAKYKKSQREEEPHDLYPPDSRFVKLHYPAVRARQHVGPDNTNTIWSQIPLAGSLIISLYPVPREKFKEEHGFDVQDIPALVKFAKETGRVQFALAAYPTRFEGLNHLDQIFTELSPPVNGQWIIESLFSSKDEASELKRTFYEKAQLKLKPFIEKFTENNFPSFNTKQKAMAIELQLSRLCRSYLFLKVLGKDDIAQRVFLFLSDNPQSANLILRAYYWLLYEPTLDMRRASRNVDFESLSRAGTYISSEDSKSLLSSVKTFPCEIGAFLMRKRTPYTESFEAMEYMVRTYKQEKLYNVMESLNNAIISKSPDLVTTKANDISEILDNVWKDAKRIRGEIKKVDFGISLALGVIGPVVGYMAAEVPGLLAALGLSVIEKSSDFFGGVGEKIIRRLRPSYLLNVYDFQTKHQIE